MVKRAAAVALFVAFAPACAELDPSVLYRCESDRACLQAGFSCWSDGYCHASAEPTDSGSGGGGAIGGGGGGAVGGGGGATGGGGGATGGGGGATGGGGGATGGGGGATGGGGGATGGGGGATGGGGGTACTPCPATSCGYFDAGCGETYCGGCAAGTECGVARPNRCDTPRLCMQDGWCFENPLPQGNTIRSAWAAGPREVYFVGDNATALLWNGERHSVIALPSVGEGVDFFSVHGTSPQDIFIVGSEGTILHYDGSSWSQELIAGSELYALRAVWARVGKPALAVGADNKILRRLPDATWDTDRLTDGLINFTDVSEGPDGQPIAVGTFAAPLNRAAFVREREDAGLRSDGGPATPIWDRAPRPPLITGNSVWVSPDGGIFVAGLADGGSGMPRVGMVLVGSPDGGWDQAVRVSDELRVVRGFTSDELFAAGDNGLFVHVVDGGPFVSRLGSTWHAMALLPPGPLVEGQGGQVARHSSIGLTPLSAGTTLNVNGLCGPTSSTLFAASQGTPGCSGATCSSLWLERTTSGGAPRWNQSSLSLPDTSEFVACGSFFDFRWLIGDEAPLRISVTGLWSPWDPRSSGVPNTRSTGIWVESGVRQWITNRTQPPPTSLPHVTRVTGTPNGPLFRAVHYDGGGDLVTVMGGAFGRGWALGERGLAFTVQDDGGLEPAVRVGTDDFVSISQADLRDGGSLTIRGHSHR